MFLNYRCEKDLFDLANPDRRASLGGGGPATFAAPFGTLPAVTVFKPHFAAAGTLILRLSFGKGPFEVRFSFSDDGHHI